MIREAIGAVVGGASLTVEEAAGVMEEIMTITGKDLLTNFLEMS